MVDQAVQDGTFKMTILGRTIEHLGSQMYKHRAPAIAELVANCWDALATQVWIDLPDPSSYSPANSILIRDNGEGMTEEAIQSDYLVIGRNRRESDGGDERRGRKIMGRKGIGKLAGFGLASTVEVTTWSTHSQPIKFQLSLHELRLQAGAVQDRPIAWSYVKKLPTWGESGTQIRLFGLKHTTPIYPEALSETLSRRFSRTTRGSMQIHVNDEPLPEPALDLVFNNPAEDGKYLEEEVDGQLIRYRYSFANKPIASKELRGFVVYAHERTAQAPPFFFDVESTASGQHSTRYVTGEIIADFIDDGDDSDTDVVSTDRQEVDWEQSSLKEFLEWGKQLSRQVLVECANFKSDELTNWVLEDDEFSTRLSRLEKHSQSEVQRFLKVLGLKHPADDPRTRDLADALIRAYEFRTFHDVVEDLEEVGDNPDELATLLRRLFDWKVLESRAILEIVKGRLAIIEKLRHLLTEDAPERASAKQPENLHDLLADHPWIFNPEWQVFREETGVRKQLREWGERDAPDEIGGGRMDFLAFGRDNQLVIIEIKRSGIAVTLEEVQRLERYQNDMLRARDTVIRVLVHNGTVNIKPDRWQHMQSDEEFEVLTWSEMFERAERFYSHYRAVLEGAIGDPDFRLKEEEVLRTREILESGARRSRSDRAGGVGDTRA